MKILITGANGYLGKETARFLLKSTPHQVIGISRHWDEGSLKDARFKKLTWDLLSSLPMGKIKGVDVLIHLASVVKIKLDSSQEIHGLLNQNAGMMFNVLNWAQAQGVKKFIFASSMTVYKNNPPKGRLSTKSRLGPAHFYGLSKFWAEEMLRLYCANGGITNGLVIRFPGLFGGERKAGMLYNAAGKFKTHEDIKLDLNKLGNWDVLHVRDAAQILGRLVDGRSLKENFTALNAGYGDRMDLNDMLKRMKQYFHSSSRVSILNKRDYCPCSMDTGPLKRLIGSWRFNRSKGLGLLLEEMR